ncbi:MAG: hypothetical protein JO154_08905 [Chitinophaga sp.]|uniref:hypothetical protein n=1 Tax=Chitinophaga sp. TaxID=1869181 RepID=UPI0025BA688F|nr:hypothetical protein [Chitinophaga sp.]MBV8252714.1 hypothetical protein [Chitinophaga sp.]
MQHLENSIHVKAEQDRICRSWLTVVEELREENALLIRLLAAALSRTVTQEFVETAEKYQARFLIVEEGLLLLRHEIGEVREWLKKQTAVKVPFSFHELQRDVDKTEQDFVALRAHFLQFAGMNQ